MERLPETCSEIRATLPLFAGYDLEAPEMEAVAGHLERCDECREACEKARRARDVLGSLRSDSRARAKACPDLWSGVRSQLITEGLLESGPRVARPFSSPRWWVGSTLSAAAAVLFVVSYLGGSNDFTPGPGGPGSGAPGSAAVGPREQTAAGDLAAAASAGETADVPSPGPTTRSTSRPAIGELASGGGAPNRMRRSGPQARGPVVPPSADAPSRSLGKLRHLEPGEAGLYEQVLSNTRVVPVQVQYGTTGNRNRRLYGVR